MSATSTLASVGEEHLDALTDLLTLAFGPAPNGDASALRERLRLRLPETTARFQDGRLASAATMRDFEAWIGGVRHRIGGLASVATYPWARRQGHVVALLQHGFERLHEQGVGWCAEHPFDPFFYGRYGFQSLPNGHMVEVPPAWFGGGDPPAAENLPADRWSELKPVHEAFARRYSLAFSRRSGVGDAWRDLVQPWWSTPRRVYLLEDAYLVFHLSNDSTTTLFADDYGYATAAGRERLWRLLASFRGQTQHVRIHLPPGDALLSDTQARHGVRSPLVQLRVVDLAAALAPLRAATSQRWTLEVSDAMCPWNDGTFEVSLSPDGCHLERSRRSEADAALDVRALAALLGHAATPETLLADGRARGRTEPLWALAELTRAQPVFHANADGF